MTLLRILVIGAMLASMTVVAVAADKPAEALQGTWTLVYAKRNGQAAEDIVGHQLTFTADKFTIKNKDGKLVYEGTFKVDADKKPATIDFQHSGDALKGKTWKGIYVIDGDTLKTCDNAPDLTKDRPANFEAKADSGYVAIAFKRAKK